MMATPMVRVVSPHEFCQACSLVFSSVSNSMPNILLKFCPRQWLVAPWMPLPVSGMKACVHVEVDAAPGSVRVRERPVR